MKVRIVYSLNLSDRQLRAINMYFGKYGPIDRNTIKSLYENRGRDEMNIIMAEGEEELARQDAILRPSLAHKKIRKRTEI